VSTFLVSLAAVPDRELRSAITPMLIVLLAEFFDRDRRALRERHEVDW
jgi:hypothetical protein